MPNSKPYEKTPEQIKYGPLFDLVAPKDNWKNRINATVDPMDLTELEATKEDLHQAIIFFTGSVPTIERKGSKYHVTSIGYYEAVGA